MIRLNANGTLDNTFNPGIKYYSFNVRIAAYLQADGKILITGPMEAVGSQTNLDERIIRLNTDGTRDQTFDAESSNGDRAIVYTPTIRPESLPHPILPRWLPRASKPINGAVR